MKYSVLAVSVTFKVSECKTVKVTQLSLMVGSVNILKS